MRRIGGLQLSLLLWALTSAGASALAVDKTWDGEGGDVNWFNAMNWDPNGAPSLSDVVRLGS